MLLEITPTDYWYFFYGIAAGLVFVVLGLGAIAAAIKNIRGDIWTPLDSKFLAPKRERNKKIDDMLSSFEGMNESLAKIKYQLTPNSGTSMSDSVSRIEKNVEDIHKNADYTSAKLRHLDAVSPEPIFEMDIDSDGHVNCISVNNSLCELLNAKESELLGRNWITRIAQAEQKRVIEEWENAVANACPIDSIHSMRVSPRKVLPVRVQATPRANRKGELRGFFGRMNKND